MLGVRWVERIDARLAEPAERPAAQQARSRYQQVAERGRRTWIRGEGCGARFEDLEAYRVHPCAVHYRRPPARLSRG